MSQLSGGSVAPGPTPMAAPIPPITPDQAHRAALHAATVIADADELGRVLAMLGIRGLL